MFFYLFVYVEFSIFICSCIVTSFLNMCMILFECVGEIRSFCENQLIFCLFWYKVSWFLQIRIFLYWCFFKDLSHENRLLWRLLVKFQVTKFFLFPLIVNDWGVGRKEGKLLKINFINLKTFNHSGFDKKYVDGNIITSRFARSYFGIIPPLRGGIIKRHQIQINFF